MSYIIQWSSQINGDTGTYAPASIGKSTINVADATVDTSTSLTLTGRGYAGYGAIQQENFVRLLENFASETAPSSPTVGQLWFDTSSESLQVYTVQATGSPPTLGWSQIYPLSSTEISNSLGYTPLDSSNIFGTADEVIVTVASGNITLSTPQAIATTSSPAFTALTLNNAAGAANSSALNTYGAANGYSAQIYNQTSTAGESFGLAIAAGTNSSDSAFKVLEHSGTNVLQEIFGDGSFSLGYNGANGTIHANATGNLVINSPNSGTSLSILNAVTGAAVTTQITSTYSSAAATPLLSLLSTATNGNATFSLCGNNGTVGTTDFSIYQSGTDYSGNILVKDTSGNLHFGAGGTAAQWTISSAGNLTNTAPASGVALTINGVSGGTALTVNGTASFSAGAGFGAQVSAPSFNTTSDARLKMNVKPLTDALEKLSQLLGVSFQFRNSTKTHLGFIAQAVQPVFPELVSEADGYLSVAYSNLVGVIVEAIKELKIRLEKLETWHQTMTGLE